MISSIALLSAVLSLLPPPSPGLAGGSPGRRALPWVSATVMATRLRVERGLQAQAVQGSLDGRRVALAVVPLDDDARVYAELRTAQAFLEMADVARRDGIILQVSSGYRTFAAQTQLFHLYRFGMGPLASRPGTSNHENGHALDIETHQLATRLWLRRHAARFGFERTVPSERWHWEHW
jgi:D-alanyl-D-alanine carboxypeptidase